ncbi:DNA-processing protein DprA [Nocardia carnea]|uniref:DNA-processing protein DprA n=1 Tax=Nocardia carnea TaxID=37328 RepID=UPI002453AC68|nr:DNA-processing protein DprA [Nocardia carnea]
MRNSPPPPTIVDDPRRRLAWATVARAALTHADVVHDRLRTLPVEEVAFRLDSGTIAEVPAGARAQAQRDLDRADRCGARFLTPDDEDWPRESLAALDAPGTATASPLGLWVRGSARLDLFTPYRVAVVGARAASGYGIQVTTDFAGDFTSAGWIVVSGGAFGVDAAAHRAALVRHAPTIAVLATGIDRPYPTAHADLLDRITEHGLLVTEYPPGTHASKDRFLQRNRLVAALSRAVVIPECGLRSGTRNTARWATTLGRPVFAVPGPVFSAASAGCHDMIATGTARLTTDAAQVIDALTTEPSPSVA